jgi:hypothetical protein
VGWDKGVANRTGFAGLEDPRSPKAREEVVIFGMAIVNFEHDAHYLLFPIPDVMGPA